MTAPAVDNDLYRRLGHAWWDDDAGEFSTIRFFVNPLRFAYFMRALERERIGDFAARRLLDIGCGGGFLSEDFARAGFLVSGIDPASETIETARAHAQASGLQIRYENGSGEHLPFADETFDIATCCDVLEHVEDVARVIGEAARVLKPGGFFFFDTINRTLMSRIAIIKVMQEWRLTAFSPPNAHVWKKFIAPRELTGILASCGLYDREMSGITTKSNPFAVWRAFRQRAKGKITFRELGERLAFRESADLSVSYMGYAVKPAG